MYFSFIHRNSKNFFRIIKCKLFCAINFYNYTMRLWEVNLLKTAAVDLKNWDLNLSNNKT